MLNDSILAKLAEPFDLWQHEYREQTKGQYPNRETTGYITYIGIEHAIGRFNEVLGSNWSWDITETQIIPMGDKHAVVTKGRIIYFGQDGREYFRTGQGAAQFTSGADDLDKVVKSSQAEAFKKASHQFGVGAYLWDKGLADQIAYQLVNRDGKRWALKYGPKKPTEGNPHAPVILRELFYDPNKPPQGNGTAAAQASGPAAQTPVSAPAPSAAAPPVTAPAAGDAGPGANAGQPQPGAHGSPEWVKANQAMRGAIEPLMKHVHGLDEFKAIDAKTVRLAVEPVLQGCYRAVNKDYTSATQLSAAELDTITAALKTKDDYRTWVCTALAKVLRNPQPQAA